MNVIITGSSGFIGNRLRNHLINNNHIVVNFKEIVNYPNFKPDLFIHCASATPGNTNTSTEIFDSNTRLLNSVSEYILKIQPRYFFNLSSMSIFGESPSGLILEDSPSNKLNLYGLSKLSSEQYIFELSKKFEFMFLSVRLPGVVGLGSSNIFLMNVLEKLKSNSTVTIYNKNVNFNNLTHPDDIISVLDSFINNKISINFLNVYSLSSLKLIEVVNYLKSKFSSQSLIVDKTSEKSGFQIGSIYPDLANLLFNSTLTNLDKIDS